MAKSSNITIQLTQNGYVILSNTQRFEESPKWSFETMENLTKKLPDILDIPIEKQPKTTKNPTKGELDA